jgi:uncharacterized membrane protein YccC
LSAILFDQPIACARAIRIARCKMQGCAASLRSSWSLPEALGKLSPPLLFAIRLWVSVCLALFIAFWLELDNPAWAGGTAAIVCQPQLGASLQKGWFRMIGTVIGAATIVVLTGCFAQDRIAYLGSLALWGSLCAFAATLLRNFASYSAALAGSTAAIIAAANLGATGGASPDVFLVAVNRASEICIGIACAGLVLAGTDLGGARRRLATAFADLAAETAGRFTRMLVLTGPQTPDTQSERRELLRRVIALEPAVDQALGESSHVRLRVLTLETAIHGLLRALDGWRGVATHLSWLPDQPNRLGETILRRMPAELRSAREPGISERWVSDPLAPRRACEEALRTLLAMPAGTPSLRLLADETAKVLAGLVHALDGLALLVDAPGRPLRGYRGFRPSIPDWLPALVNAARAFIAIVGVTVFWIATAWPSGASAIVFTVSTVLSLAPRGDAAYGGAIAVTIAIVCALPSAAIMKFAMLPAFETFPALCGVLGLFFLPAGFAMVRIRQPVAAAVFTTIALVFLPLLAPTNQMSYDAAQFYNSALATVTGCAIVALVFALLPPLSPAARARRLLALALRDLRSLAVAHRLPTSADWERRMYGRVMALPEQAAPSERARLLAALSVGAETIHLRHFAPRFGAAGELDTALAAFARGDSEVAVGLLRQIDRDLDSRSDGQRPTAIALRARSRILIICEALSEHASYFDEEHARAAG